MRARAGFSLITHYQGTGDSSDDSFWSEFFVSQISLRIQLKTRIENILTLQNFFKSYIYIYIGTKRERGKEKKNSEEACLFI